MIEGWIYVLKRGLHISWHYIALSSILAVLAVILNALKFYTLVKINIDEDFSFALWLKIFSQSSLMNNVIPQGGTFYRAKFLKNYVGMSYTDFIGLSYLFAFLGLSYLMVLVGILFAVSFHSALILFLALAILFIILIKIFLLKYLSKLTLTNPKLSFYWSKLSTIFDLLRTSLRSRQFSLLLLLYLVGAVIDYAVFFCICMALGIQNNMLAVLILYTMLSLAWLIRITPGNIGIQELMIGLSSKVIGSGFVIGITLSVMSRMVYLVANSLIWLILKFMVRI